MTNGVPPASSGIAKLLAGGLTVFSGGIAVLGAATGSLQRVMRNHPLAAAICFGVAVLAVAFGVILPAMWAKVPDGVLAIGALFLFGSIGVLGGFIVDSASTKERPRVAASLSKSGDHLSVKGSVEASGLSSGEHILIRVEGRTTRVKLAALHSGRPRGSRDPLAPYSDDYAPLRDYYQLVYGARVGPDADGKVKAPIATRIPHRLYDRLVVSAQVVGKADPVQVAKETVRRCSATTTYWGCIAILVPGDA
jgi:hypothetical protein